MDTDHETSSPRRPTHRWALVAVGLAAAALTGGVGIATATSPPGATAYVPISPCRLADTRPAPFNVGDRATPLGPDEAMQLVGRGERGECVGAGALPANVNALQLNVTALNATEATFVALYPSGGDRPNASHLNPIPGAAAAPNAVTVRLADDGGFTTYNRFGYVDVIVDVVGYYTDHHHDDRYYTRGDVDDRLAPLEALLEPAPWALHVPPDAMTMYRTSIETTDLFKTFSAAGSTTLMTSFRLPDDYVAGTDLRAELLVSVSGFGEIPECGARLDVTYSRGSRLGHFGGITVAFDNPPDPTQPNQTVLTVPPGDASSSPLPVVIELRGAEALPGDWVRIGLARQGDDAADTCPPLDVHGLTVRAS